MTIAPANIRPIAEIIKSRDVTAREWCTGETPAKPDAKPARVMRGHRARRSFGKRNAR